MEDSKVADGGVALDSDGGTRKREGFPRRRLIRGERKCLGKVSGKEEAREWPSS